MLQLLKSLDDRLSVSGWTKSAILARSGCFTRFRVWISYRRLLRSYHFCRFRKRNHQLISDLGSKRGASTCTHPWGVRTSSRGVRSTSSTLASQATSLSEVWWPAAKLRSAKCAWREAILVCVHGTVYLKLLPEGTMADSKIMVDEIGEMDRRLTLIRSPSFKKVLVQIQAVLKRWNQEVGSDGSWPSTSIVNPSTSTTDL